MWFRQVNQSSVADKILLPQSLVASILWMFSGVAARKSNKNRTLSALLAFGDSILDTGNNNHLNTLAKFNLLPYRKDFIGGKPTGRFCNGKVLTDLIAEGLGIKEAVPAYFDPNLPSTDLVTGLCFASGLSGLYPSVMPLSDQFNNFKEYLENLKGVVVVGEETARTIISNSLFLVSTGNNDIAVTYLGTPSRSLRWTWDTKISSFRYLAIGLRAISKNRSRRDSELCAETFNQSFNSKLSSDINNLKRALTQAEIVYIDVYYRLLDLTNNPAKAVQFSGKALHRVLLSIVQHLTR